MPGWERRENIKFYRKQLGKTQAELGFMMNTTPQTISNWEQGISAPNLEEIKELSKIFGISLDQLFSDTHLKLKEKGGKKRVITHPNTHGNTLLNEQNGSFLNEPNTPYFTSKMPAVITVNQVGVDNIIFVPAKAQAGYLIGYQDPEFIESLPSFQMPGLRNGTFRMFEVEGISMSPTLSNKDRVIGEYIQNINELRENRVHIVVTKDGILIKRVINRIKERGMVYLKSDTLTHRPDYPIIEIDPSEIIELWYVRMRISADLREPSEMYTRLTELELNMQKVVEKLGLK